MLLEARLVRLELILSLQLVSLVRIQVVVVTLQQLAWVTIGSLVTAVSQVLLWAVVLLVRYFHF